MPTLAETLAAKKDPELDEDPIVEPPPVVVPIALTLPEGAPVSVPHISKDHQRMLATPGEPFVTQLLADGSRHINVAPQVVIGGYAAVDGSRRGYQWTGGIIRPNQFGIYLAGNAEEAEFLAALATAGILQAAPSGSFFPDQV